jgi:hypothetical protein
MGGLDETTHHANHVHQVVAITALINFKVEGWIGVPSNSVND